MVTGTGGREMMRPRTIALAEALFLASVLLLVVGSVMTWQEAVATLGTGLALGSVLAVIVVPVLLLLWATRGRSRIGLWLLTAWTVLSVWGVARQVGQRSDFNLVAGLTVLQVALMVIAVALLFARSSRPWFAGHGQDAVADGQA